MGEVMSAQGKKMSEIKSNLAALSTQMAAMMEEVKKNRIDRAQSRSPSQRKGDKQGCHRCEVVGGGNNRDNRDTEESIEEDEKGVEDNIGVCDTMRKKTEQ